MFPMMHNIRLNNNDFFQAAMRGSGGGHVTCDDEALNRGVPFGERVLVFQGNLTCFGQLTM